MRFEGDSVLVGIPTRGLVPMQWALGLRALVLPTKSTIVPVSGLPFDHARNALVKEMIKSSYDWIFFLDDDVLPPPDAFEKLRTHGRLAVSGLYFRRTIPLIPVALHDTVPDPSPIGGYLPGQQIEVDLVGAGCLLLHKKIFETIPKPWFEWCRDREDLPERDRVSEDFAFCRKLRQYGVKVLLDTSVECTHMGYGQSDVGGRFTPLETMSSNGHK
jgi:hypothetical protein